MHANNLVVDHSTTWQAVEGITKLLPHLDREAATAFIVKAINSVDSSTFMVTSQEEEVLRIFDFVGEQKTDNFKRLLSAINIVSEKQIVSLITTNKSMKSGERALTSSVHGAIPRQNTERCSPPAGIHRIQKVVISRCIAHVHRHRF